MIIGQNLCIFSTNFASGLHRDCIRSYRAIARITRNIKKHCIGKKGLRSAIFLPLQMEQLLVDEAIREEGFEGVVSGASEGFLERSLAIKQAEDGSTTARHGGIARS